MYAGETHSANIDCHILQSFSLLLNFCESFSRKFGLSVIRLHRATHLKGKTKMNKLPLNQIILGDSIEGMNALPESPIIYSLVVI